MTTFRDLPQDIIHCVVDYLDSNSELLQTGLCSKLMSRICLQKLWHTAVCETPLSLNALISTLNSDNLYYPYHDWLMGLDISFPFMQILLLPPILLQRHNINKIQIKNLNLMNIHGSTETSDYIYDLFTQNNLKSIHVSNCSNEMISSLLQSKTSTCQFLSIQDCDISDSWVKQMVSRTPRLRYFSSQRSGYLSDSAIVSITQHCALIETLIVTLPNHIIQSNTITMFSLQSIAKCNHIKRFVCRGQVRIATRECQDWLYAHCPTLEYCDLSF